MLNPFDSAEDLAPDGDLATDGGDALSHGDGFEDEALSDGFEAADGFESDGMDSADGFSADGYDSADAFSADDFSGDGFQSDTFSADAFSADAYSADDAQGDGLDGGDMDLWNAFEEEVADGLDAAEEDEFIGRLLGGLGRVGGLLMRRAGGVQGIARTAGNVARGARRVGQIAGQAGRVASRISPAASAAARLARLLGAPGLASGLDTVSRGARTAAQIGRRASGVAGGVGRAAAGFGSTVQGLGQAAHSGQALLAQLSQLIGGGGDEFDDFDAMADLYDEGVDEALPGMVAMAARAAARGLGFQNLSHLGQAGRRALVRGVAAAARELMRSRDPQAIRQLPRLTHAAGRTAARTAPTPQQATQRIRRALPRTARRVATQPQALPPATRSRPASVASPIGRPRHLGRGHRPRAVIGQRSFKIDGPVTVTISPR
jgi:hypothetical protein